MKRSMLKGAAMMVASLMVVGSGSVAAQDEGLKMAAEELTREGLASHRAFELVRSLTFEVGPRFAGSPGDARAVAWAERAMKELGLANVHAEEVTVPQWIRGEAEAAIVSPHAQELVVTALGGSVGTPEEGVVAEVVEVESLEALEALSEEEVEGRIVFFNRRMERRRDGSDYGTVVRPRGRGPSAAARKGAVAMVLRSVGTGTHRFPHTGATRYAEDAPKIPAAALAIPDADILEAQLAGGEKVRLRLRLTSRRLGDTLSANVIGEVVGRERPEEIVLLAAHLDSWDLGTGAIDDGAGCAVVLEAARLVGSLPRAPRRTIRVLLAANEEFGLSGGKAYADAHAEEIPRHVLAIESDLGGGRVWQLATRVHAGAVPYLRQVHTLLEPLGVAWSDDLARGGADISPLRKLRVPMVDLAPDATSYFDYHHTADDTVDKLDPDDLAQHATAFAILSWAVADGEVETRPAPAVEE